MLIYLAARWCYPPHEWRILTSYSFTFSSLVLMTRTFSNTTETVILAAAIALAAYANRLHYSMTSITLERQFFNIAFVFGLLIGVGAAIRVSFLFFACPIGVFFIILYTSHLPPTQPLLRRLIQSTIYTISIVSIPALLVSAVFILVDSIFYSTLSVCRDGGHHCSNGIATATEIMTTSILEGRIPAIKVRSLN